MLVAVLVVWLLAAGRPTMTITRAYVEAGRE
jgi:hypothetical protein